MFAEMTPRTELRIVASAEAPRSAARDEPTGERAITVRDGQQIDIALHGKTTGGVSIARTGNRDGRAVSLTPGSSDATPRLPGARAAPSAGILTVRGHAWSWRPIEDVK